MTSGAKKVAGVRWHKRLTRPFILQEIVPLLEKGERTTLNGYGVNFGTSRLQTFMKGTGCVSCDLVGVFFVFEQDFGGGVHLNLYAIDKSGREVMMTSDHIRPRSRGGAPKDLMNRQPMCEPCNSKKGTNYVT